MRAFERLTFEEVDWAALDALPDRVVFQTREWVEFIARTQGAEPVVARVLGDGETKGWFTGLLLRRFGVKILGSPFPGWTTSSMGFNLLEGSDRRELARDLAGWAFRNLGCLHLELKDRALSVEDLDGLGYEHTPNVTYEVDLSVPEAEVFARMTSACRRAIRKSEKEGVASEEATPDGFAEEYYAQLEDVFARQGLRPTYGVDRVRALIESLHPTGRLLLVRARSTEGDSVATGIFPAFNGVAYFWGGASWRERQLLRPNESVFWFAMRFWQQRGIETLDLGGGGTYKLKYGPRELSVPFFRKSRLPGLPALRSAARYVVTRRLHGRQ